MATGPDILITRIPKAWRPRNREVTLQPTDLTVMPPWMAADLLPCSVSRLVMSGSLPPWTAARQALLGGSGVGLSFQAFPQALPLARASHLPPGGGELRRAGAPADCAAGRAVGGRAARSACLSGESRLSWPAVAPPQGADLSHVFCTREAAPG